VSAAQPESTAPQQLRWLVWLDRTRWAMPPPALTALLVGHKKDEWKKIVYFSRKQQQHFFFALQLIWSSAVTQLTRKEWL
jgi:hypothetical protein